jgi:hypothetical protein
MTRFALPLAVAAATLTSFCAAACGESPDTNAHSTTKASASTEPADGRTNNHNNGSTYEPCTAMAKVVATLGLDANTKRDLATIPRDPTRGCRWTDDARREQWDLTQIVTNWASLEQYRSRHQAVDVWLPDLTIRDRTIGVFKDPHGSCGTYVQSGMSGVLTTVGNSSGGTGFDECAKAIEATTAVIDQIPR